MPGSIRGRDMLIMERIIVGILEKTILCLPLETRMMMVQGSGKTRGEQANGAGVLH